MALQPEPTALPDEPQSIRLSRRFGVVTEFETDALDYIDQLRAAVEGLQAIIKDSPDQSDMDAAQFEINNLSLRLSREIENREKAERELAEARADVALNEHNACVFKLALASARCFVAGENDQREETLKMIDAAITAARGEKP